MLPLEVITSAIFLFLSVYSVGSLMYECVYACFPWIIFYFITFWIFLFADIEWVIMNILFLTCIPCVYFELLH